MFSTEAEYIAERKRHAATKARWREQDRVDTAFHVVLATVMLGGTGAFACFAAFAMGGIEGLAWLFGVPLALFAFGLEVWKRV